MNHAVKNYSSAFVDLNKSKKLFNEDTSIQIP